MTNETTGHCDPVVRARCLPHRYVIVAAITVAFAIGSTRAATFGAQQSPSAGGVSDAQNQRGETAAQNSCVSCHGEKLVGTDIAPPLLGEAFTSNWIGKSAADLFEKIHTTMPADAPGTLTPEQTADVVAYVFRLNKLPAGSAELTPDTSMLSSIKIAKP